MTRKDYELICKHAKQYTRLIKSEAVKDYIISLALRIKDNNPKFDHERFVEDCGFKS